MRSIIKISLVSLLFTSLGAEVLSYDELKNQPKSLAKDYYIYRLITETNYNKNEVKNLKSQIYRNRGKLREKMDKIFPTQTKPKFDNCQGIHASNILDANASCKLARSYPNFVAQLPEQTRKILADEFSQYNTTKHQKAKNLMLGFNSSNPAKYFYDLGDGANYLLYYKYLKSKDKTSMIDISMDENFITDMVNEKAFSDILNDAIIKDKYPNLQKSLLKTNANKTAKETAFLLGVNAIKHGKEGAAKAFFSRAANTLERKHDVENAKFWLYLLGDNNALNELSMSENYSIYTLYAKEITGNKVLNLIVPQPTKTAPQNYDISDPFNWVKTKAKADKMSPAQLREWAKFFDTKTTIGEYSYLMNKANGGKDNFYAMPFMELIGDGNNHRKALILALARQESRFIPSAVSTSYALGMMQFMPFLANDIGKKQLKIPNFDQDDMFKPSVAYKFANLHLDWLEKKLTSPVFIAYAYNGGLGFTTKMLQRDDMFKAGKFEPFLSMELVPFAESRDYAKKVLANYIIYSQLLEPNKFFSVKTELDKLLIPSKSDKIR